MTDTVFFNNKTALVNHILFKIDIDSSIRVQKLLYLLYAYYGATYGSINNQEGFEEFETYPARLFKANFEAWQYGPVDSDVWRDYKRDEYKPVEYNTETAQEKNVILFLNDLIEQTNEINDFGLVERTHQDKVWSDNYKDGQKHISIDSDSIIREYRERYV
jgi:hypothetical protein